MKEILLGILIGVLILIGFIIVIYVLAVYPSTFLNEFEKSCHKAINKKDEEFEETEKFNKELKDLLFK